MGKKRSQEIEEESEEEPQELPEESEPSDDENNTQNTKLIGEKTLNQIKISITKGVQGAKKLLKLYRKACRSGEEEVPIFTNAQVHNEILVLSLQELPKLFKKKLGKKLDQSSNWKRLNNLLRSFLANTLILLKVLKSEKILSIAFQGLSKIAKLLHLMPEYSQLLIKQAAKLWGEEKDMIKLSSYSFLRNALENDVIDKIELLKSVYKTFDKNAKFMSWAKYQDIDLMRRCFVDLLGLDLSASYQVIFIYLRQLSLSLSEVIKNPSTDRVKTLYNWQYLNSLCLLAQSIIKYPTHLSELAFPLVQICQGLLQITNIPKYFPIKLHFIRLLIALQASSQTYIPIITPHLLEILLSASLQKKSKPAKLKAFHFIMALKASKEQLTSETYKEQLIEEVCDSLLEHMAGVGNAISFPEIMIPIKITLKKHAKTVRNGGIRGRILHTIKLIEDNAEFVNKKRLEMNLPPISVPITIEGNCPLWEQRDKILKRRAEIIRSKISSLSEENNKNY